MLKVPHHGSAYFDPDFLAAVHARVGVISVGLNNDYGHPSPLLLTELAKIGVPVRRTDMDGDVAVVGPSARLTTVQRGTSASELSAGGFRSVRRARTRLVSAGLSPQPGSEQRRGSSTPRWRHRDVQGRSTRHGSVPQSARSPPCPAADHCIG